MSSTSSLISMPDIAKLARVQRPVVSMWKRRSASSDLLPFPMPVIKHGREFFDTKEIGAWLTATGRGNNPDAEADAAGFAELPSSDQPASDNFAAVTALLVLRSMLARPLGGMQAEGLIAAAEEHDGGDEMIVSEIELAAADLEVLAPYVDGLVEGAYSEAVAFEKLITEQFALGQSSLTATAFTPATTELLSQTIAALILSGEVPGQVVDVTGNSTDVLIAIGTNERIQEEVSFALARHANANARLSRRRFRVHGIEHETIQIEPDGAFETLGRVVHVAQFPPADRLAMGSWEMLTAIEQISLQMNSDQVAVILGPATVLSGSGLDKQSDGLRSQMLGSGVVRAIVQLPKGLRRTLPRQAQSVWLLGRSQDGIARGDRIAFVANLSSVALDDAVVQSLVGDLLASAGGLSMLKAHHFRLGTLALNRKLAATSESLVASARIPGPRDRSNSAARSLQVEALRARVMERTEVVPMQLPHAEIAEATNTMTPIAVSQLLGDRRVQYVPGNRLLDGDIAVSAGPATGFRVIGAAEIYGERPVGTRSIDRLVFGGHYPAGRVSEPGDIIFCTSPRPRAIIDAEGTSVVEYPARILRIDHSDPDGLLSETVRADINAQIASDKDWRGWRLRRVSIGQRAVLGNALAALRVEQSQAQSRLAQLEELATLLIDVTAEGNVALVESADLRTPSEGTI